MEYNSEDFQDSYWMSETSMPEFELTILTLLWIFVALWLQDPKFVLGAFLITKIADYIFWEVIK